MNHDKYEIWYEENYDELTIAAAERGCDRELDFDWDRFIEREYEAYLGGLK